MRVAVLGAGPAGLFAAWLLQQRGVEVTVFEARPTVGGISRSVNWHGFSCDLGAHRLFAHDEGLLRLLLALVPMGRHIRRSRVRAAGAWIHDPVNIVELLWHSPPAAVARVVTSYLTRPRRTGTPTAVSFDDYVEWKYGTALNDLFFRPYTERMFSLPGAKISADWAREKVRIGGPLDAVRQSSKRNFGYFYYPLHGGFGAIAERLAHDLRSHVWLETPVQALEISADRVRAVVYSRGDGRQEQEFDHVVSTLPLTALGRLLGREVALSYQGVRFVYLLVNRPSVSDNHWLYFMDRDHTINRLVEFKNLSTMDQPQERTVLCAEVTRPCVDVVAPVIDDVARSGLARREEIVDTLVLDEGYGYAVYDLGYAERLAAVRAELGQVGNLHLLGRSAEFSHLEVDDILDHALDLANRLAPLQPVQMKGNDAMTAEQEPGVYAVILTYNHYDDTRECLESLLRTDYPNLRVVVVDNGSADGTPGRVRAEFPGVEVLETGRNLGVPWGYNVGFSHALHAGAEYILMLNNDTIVDPQMLRLLLEACRGEAKAGIVMPKVLYYDDPDVIWSAGGRHRAFPPAIVIVGQDRPSAAFDRPFHLEYALSCGLLIHRRAFERAGLFDPGYFFYFDDWDFSHRVRAHGMEIIFAPQARMWHKVSRSTGEREKAVLFWRTWGESITRFYRRHGRPVLLSLPLHVGTILARELIKGNGRMLGHFVAGVREGLSRPLGPIPTPEDVVLPPVPREEL